MAFLISACEEPLQSRYPLSEPGQAPYDERLLGMWYAVADDELRPISLYILPAAEPHTLDVVVVGIDSDEGELLCWVRFAAHATEVAGATYFTTSCQSAGATGRRKTLSPATCSSAPSSPTTVS